MDYTQQPLIFRLKKALRYARLYGPRRTWCKVMGQYHMKRAYAVLPPKRPRLGSQSNVAVIGCGNFAFSTIAFYLKKKFGHVLRAAMDIDANRAASLFEAYSLEYWTTDFSEILRDDAIRLCYIASNHASHAEYAISALRAGKAVHIEKPHVVNEDQLLRLCDAMHETQGRVALGFNRPNSRIGQKIAEYLGREHGPVMMNWFVAGHEIPADHWYFRAEEGGRVLGNLCHWTDFVYHLVPEEKRFPITITPTQAEKSDCDIAVTYLFGDGSIAAITFSAKGHTFEGVRERFAAHKGNVLISMDDFGSLRIDVADKTFDFSRLFRDHGHEQRIVRSYDLVRLPFEAGSSSSVKYVWETGMLFLKTREALESKLAVTISSYPEVKPGNPAAVVQCF